MFEDRSISIFAYNIETLLAEKIETIMSRSVVNTRMRDFYDVYEIFTGCYDEINVQHLCQAFKATCRKRNTENLIPDMAQIIKKISDNENMAANWNNYKAQSFYVGNLSWNETVAQSIKAFELLSNELAIAV